MFSTLTLALIFTAITALASPAPTISSLPECYQTCFNTATADASCKDTDPSCYCKSQVFQSTIKECVDVSCSSADRSLGQGIINSECSSFTSILTGVTHSTTTSHTTSHTTTTTSHTTTTTSHSILTGVTRSTPKPITVTITTTKTQDITSPTTQTITTVITPKPITVPVTVTDTTTFTQSIPNPNPSPNPGVVTSSSTTVIIVTPTTNAGSAPRLRGVSSERAGTDTGGFTWMSLTSTSAFLVTALLSGMML